MIWTYDEWGGWYDHVPPRRPSLPTTSLPTCRRQSPGAFDRTGSGCRPGHLALRTARLRLPPRLRPHVDPEDGGDEWNLPALTRRDANATDVLAMIDLRSQPAFLKPPRLPAPANPALTYRCLATGPVRFRRPRP